MARLHRALTALYVWLDARPAFRPLLLFSCAIVVGLMMTPTLSLRNYALNEATLGVPSSENMKAPYDLEIRDDEATGRMVEEAAQKARQVFDFDDGAGERLVKRVHQAFGAARRASGGALPDDNVRSARVFADTLGVAVAPKIGQALFSHGYSHELEQGLAQLLLVVEAEPIVDERSALTGSRERGILLESLSGKNPRARRLIEDVDAIPSVAQMRTQMPGVAIRSLPEISPGLSAEHREEIGSLLALLLEPNISFNRAASERLKQEAEHGIAPVTVTIKKGEMIIRDGERITARHLQTFQTLYRNSHGPGRYLVGLGSMVLLLLLTARLSHLFDGPTRALGQIRARDLLFLFALFIFSLLFARLWLLVARALEEAYPSIPPDAFLYIMPVAASGIIVRLVLRAEVALVFVLITSFIVGLLTEGDRMLTLYSFLGALAAMGQMGTLSARSSLLWAGLSAGLTQAACAVGIQFFLAAEGTAPYLWSFPASLLSGFLSGVLALALTPVIEVVFDFTTDLKLLELANLNHPALKELIVQAPGSYHHSIIVGALVEAAAESVGANPLLARVMAYYHDLGKGCNPAYFVENQRLGQNPHDKIKPSISAMVIRRHVADGMQIARRHGLGEQILAGIAQHHGTTLIQYFYHKAKELAGPTETVAEADFRYGGQKPQTREAALVMLGDSLEAASRSLQEPTSARLQGLVTRIINNKFADGQLEECDLTLRDLHTIARAFSRVLVSIYHHRLEYPEGPSDAAKKKLYDDSHSTTGSDPTSDDLVSQGPPTDHLRRLGLP